MKCYSYCNDSGWCQYYQPGIVECPYSNVQHQVTEEKCRWCNHIMTDHKCPIGCTKENHYNK